MVGHLRMGVVALSLGVALVAPREARSQSTEAAALLREGVTLRQQGRDEDALARFRRAWELTRSPQSRGQMGLASQALGRWAEADECLRDALEVTSDPWVIAFRRPLEQAHAAVSQHMGMLDVRGNLTGAEVFVDGRRVGTLPLERPARVVAGGVTLEVRAPGHYPVTRQVSVPGGGIARESVDLAALPSAPVIASTPIPSPPTVVPPPPATPPPTLALAPAPAVRDEAAPGLALRIAGVASMVVGAGALAVGVVGLVQRNDAARAYNTEPCISDPDRAECAAHVEGFNGSQGMLLGGFIAGGVLAATGVVLFLVAPSSSRARSAMCAPSISAPGIDCAVRF